MHSRLLPVFPLALAHSALIAQVDLSTQPLGNPPPAAAVAEPAAPAPTATETSLKDALIGGKLSATARVRYETVTQDGLADADELTARLRLGYTTADYKGLQAKFEGEAVMPVAGDSFDGTGVNAERRATIADPETYQVNQAWGAYTYEKTKITLGRQSIVLDTARFIGDVGFRQNQQTFDAAVIKSSAVDQLDLTYGYLSRINRVFDDSSGPDGTQYDWSSQSHLLNAAYHGIPYGSLTGYAYLLDFDRAADFASINSSQTYGLSFDGSVEACEDATVLYRLEYATQSDYGSSPLSYRADYYLGELGVKVFKSYTVAFGHEVLGSDDGVTGFKTPLATLHAYQGWADRFLNTPAAGVADTYVKVAATLPANFSFLAFYHWFHADDTSASYGNELDLQLGYKLNAHVSFTAKAAFYEGDGEIPSHAQDTTKFWVQGDYTY